MAISRLYLKEFTAGCSKQNNFMNFLKNNKILVFIILFSFLLSLGYSFYYRIKPVVDARAYDSIAKNIVSCHGYREDLNKDLAHDYAIARVGPLYQYFLAGIYKIFGIHHEAVWIWQAILHALTAWLVYLAALLIFSSSGSKKKIAFLSAAIIGFYPDLVEISAMLLSETLYLFLICLLLYIFFRFSNQKNYWLALILGLVSGLAVLARPPVLLFIPIILFFFYKKKLLRQALLFLIILAAVFTPWTVRNYVVYKQIMPFGAAGNFNFWIGNQHNGNGEQEASDQQIRFLASHEIKDINGESLRQFKNFLRDYPAEFLKLTILRFNKYLSIARPMGFWFYQSGIGQMIFVLSSAISSIFLFIFGFGGIINSIFLNKDRQREILQYLAAFALAVSLIIFITVVETRYRFQIYPALAIFAGYFIVWLWENAKKWRLNKAFWISFALVFLNGAIDLLMNIEKLKEKISGF